jgi:hypothetical protein
MATITEALAEIKTLDKRLEKKRDFVLKYIGRPQPLRDPLEKEGGSPSIVAKERQSISDLETRKLKLRRAIHRASDATNITIAGVTRPMTDWLVWRREISAGQKEYLRKLSTVIEAARRTAQVKGGAIVSGDKSSESKDVDVVINISETSLGEEMEKLETILGELDGQLSLKNATTNIEELAA